jgi:DNA-binding NtrC family response regulator
MSPTAARTPSVLLVEDDAGIRTSLLRYLDAAGYGTTAAESAAAALTLLESLTPDIIVTDILMSGGDGFALITAIRDRDPDLPVIAISGGRAEYDVLAQAAKLGANATIEKPFSYAYLVDTIDRCLEERAAAQGS